MTRAPLRAVEPDDVEQQALVIIEEARALAIKTDQDYEYGGAFLTRIKGVRSQIKDVFEPIIKAAHAAHKEAVAQRKGVEAPMIEAEGIVKSSMATFYRAKEAERLAQEEEQRRQAREQAEKEALARAVELEDQGKAEEAEALIERPVAPVVVPAPAIQKPQAAGVSVRKVWKFRMVNPAAVNARFLVPDEKAIGKVVRAMGADAGEMVGGIEVYAEEIVSARA